MGAEKRGRTSLDGYNHAVPKGENEGGAWRDRKMSYDG